MNTVEERLISRLGQVSTSKLTVTLGQAAEALFGYKLLLLLLVVVVKLYCWA